MSRSAFASSRPVQWVFFACCFLVMPGADLCSPGGPLVSASDKLEKPNKQPPFKGKWDGTYVDDDDPKQTGKGVYEFHDEKGGRFEVQVSWKDEKGKLYKMKLQGKRLGLEALCLEGEYDGTKYRYIGRMKKGQVVLHYLSVHQKTGRAGSGVSTLSRQK